MARNLYFFSGFFLILVSFGIKNSAAAEMLEIGIRQVRPDGPVHTAICSNEYKKCYMTMPFFPQNIKDRIGEESMDVVISFDSGGADFHFMWDREYLHVNDTEDFPFNIRPHQFSEEPAMVNLFRPHPLLKTDKEGLSVLRLPDMVAELEISAKPVPP